MGIETHARSISPLLNPCACLNKSPEWNITKNERKRAMRQQQPANGNHLEELRTINTRWE